MGATTASMNLFHSPTRGQNAPITGRDIPSVKQVKRCGEVSLTDVRKYYKQEKSSRKGAMRNELGRPCTSGFRPHSHYPVGLGSLIEGSQETAKKKRAPSSPSSSEGTRY